MVELYGMQLRCCECAFLPLGGMEHRVSRKVLISGLLAVAIELMHLECWKAWISGFVAQAVELEHLES